MLIMLSVCRNQMLSGLQPLLYSGNRSIHSVSCATQTSAHTRRHALLHAQWYWLAGTWSMPLGSGMSSIVNVSL